MENSYSGDDHDDVKMNDIPEESSWTFYIQEFMHDHDHSNYSSDCETPSLVSDAASSPLKKFKNLNVGFSSGKTNSRIKVMAKQNSFKKQKNTAIIPVLDLELEDTASSPVNSPKKVSYMSQFMKDKGKLDFAEVKRNICAKREMVAVDKETAFTDLKKRASI